MFSLLSDLEIIELVKKEGIIDPFISETVRNPGFISYGLSCNVYDVRLKPHIRLFSKSNSGKVLDPIDSNPGEFIELFGDEFVMPPGAFALGVTLESFSMPQYLFGLVLGKSTYARCGIIINPTCIMPGMKGEIVIEISNTCPMPVKIYAGDSQGICSVVFFKSSPCLNSYNGHYQNQFGIHMSYTK